MLFLCRFFSFFTLTPGAGQTMTDPSVLLGLVLACAGCILLLLPAWAILRPFPNMGIVEYAFQKSPFAGRLTAVILTLYALFEAVGSIVHFALFTTTSIYPGERIWIFIVLFTVTVLYLVWMGLEATARLSGFILAALLVSSALIIGALIPECNSVRLHSPVLNGISPALNSAGSVLSETAELIPILLFIPYIKGGFRSVFRGAIWWILLVGLGMGVMTLFIIASVGEYAQTQAYPIYAVAKTARLFYFQRLDALHMVVWTLVGLIKTFLFLYAARQNLFCILPQRTQKWILPVCGAAVLSVSLILSRSYRAYEAYDRIALSGAPLLICMLILPMVLRILPSAKRGDTI